MWWNLEMEQNQEINNKNTHTYQIPSLDQPNLRDLQLNILMQVLGWTDKYFVEAGLMRDQCHRSDSWLDIIWKYTGAKYF